MVNGLHPTIDVPFARVSRVAATASVALVSTPANWFDARISSFHEYSYAFGMLVPGMMSWNWPPITSVQASFSLFNGYARLPSQSATTDARSASSASTSFMRFHRFMYACDVIDPAEWLISSRSPL